MYLSSVFMGSVTSGIKNGLISGFIYFIISSIVNFAIIIVFIDEIVDAFGIKPAYYSIFLTELIDGQIRSLFIIGIVFGIIFSILLLKYYKRVPGKDMISKTNFLVLILWFFVFLILPAYELGTGIIIALYYYIAYAVANFFTALLFGRLLFIFNKKFIEDKSNHQ